MEDLLSKINKLNLSIFHFFNQTFGKQEVDNVSIFWDKFGGPHVFHYHFLFIIIIASILLYHKRNTKSELKELVTLGTSSIITLFLSIIFSLVLIIDSLKEYAATNRPYCALKNIHVIQEVVEKTSCLRGFPSGHMAFSIIMVASFWPLLNRAFKGVAIIILVMIGISRIASGAHYPIDLIGAILIALPITIFIRNKTETVVRKYEERLKIFDYLHGKIYK